MHYTGLHIRLAGLRPGRGRSKYRLSAGGRLAEAGRTARRILRLSIIIIRRRPLQRPLQDKVRDCVGVVQVQVGLGMSDTDLVREEGWRNGDSYLAQCKQTLELMGWLPHPHEARL